MPGPLRAFARTAVISGTATAVSHRVSRRQAARWAQRESVRPLERRWPAGAGPVTSPPDADDMTSRVDHRKRLADLEAQGVLAEEEFAARRRRLLGRRGRRGAVHEPELTPVVILASVTAFITVELLPTGHPAPVLGGPAALPQAGAAPARTPQGRPRRD